jgi:alpha-tubulin suppressor-like RCC1 family protein
MLAVITVAALASPGVTSTASASSGAVSWGDLPRPVSGLSGVIEVSASTRDSALLEDGTVVQWAPGSEEAPKAVSGLSEVAAISQGPSVLIALLRDGRVMAFGENVFGQLGNGSSEESAVPVEVSGISDAVAVSAGDASGFALLQDGTVRSWGRNEYGELGDGTFAGPELCEFEACSRTPVTVSGLAGVAAIDAGANDALALLGNGTVEAWGDDSVGQLGDGEGFKNGVSKDEPVPVTGLSGVRAVSAGTGESLAVLTDGTVRSWGDNFLGQLGNPSVESGEGRTYNAPVPVSDLAEAVAVSAGEDHDMALLANGTVVDWGVNGSRESARNELGTGTPGPDFCKYKEPFPYDEAGRPCSRVPIEVHELTGVSDISEAPEGLPALAAGPLSERVTGVNPARGAGVGGSEVTITGTNLSDATVVHFGASEAASLTVLSRTAITAVTPAGTGVVDVTVTTPEGTTPLTPRDHFDYTPLVTSVAPTGGPASGGTAVTITGEGLLGATEVDFGASAAASFTVNSDTSITAVSPPGTGQVHVTVTTPGGKSPTRPADLFTYVAAPSVATVSPNHGPSAGGTSVSVTGTGFVGATAVSFGASSATSFTVESATSITAISPPGSGTVDVTVTTTGGTSATGVADQFAYLAGPEYGRCIKVARGAGQFGNGGCTQLAGTRAYEWYPGAIKTHFTTKVKELTTVKITSAGAQITCLDETGVGNYAGSKTVNGVLMTFTGCERAGEKCSTLEAAEGEIATKPLEGVLGVTKLGETAIKDQIGLDLFPAGKTGEVMEFSCGATAVSVRGSVIAVSTKNSMKPMSTLTYSASSKGKQTPERLVGEPTDVLEASFNGAAFQRVGLAMKTVVSSEEPFEVNSVF